jgi:hypothetical protein
MVNAQRFSAQAKPMQVVIAGQPFLAQPKEFKTGSLGWYLTGKVNANIGGEIVRVQVGLNLTIIGSKPQDNGHAADDEQPAF